jgi:hypothetical protein
MIRAAAMYQQPYGLFGYVAPYRSQAKAVAWQYFKDGAYPIIDNVNEQELTITLINGSQIRLFGADNADSIRGLGFSGLYLDEYGDFKPSVFGNVLRAALSDKQGWCVFGGTPKGKNQFWEIYDTATRLPSEWFLLRLPASTSGLLPASELAAAKAQLAEDQYLQEYECSFEAAILGAFYGKEMREAADQGRITNVPYDPNLPTYTAWDLGYRDDTAIWFYQVARGEIRVIDFYAVSGANIHSIAEVVTGKPYRYAKHFLPHDARAKSLQTGKSIVEQLAAQLDIAKLAVVPDIGVQNGIQAVRMMLPRVWFDAERCGDGIEALRQYQREYDEDKKAYRASPRHDWCFTGDTEVLTRYGVQQIMNLPQSGEVWTSCGWKPYTHPRITRKNAQLVQVTFANGYSVKCTPDHAFKTDSGWKSAEHLTPNTAIQSSLTRSRSILMVACTVYSQAKRITREVGKNFTELLGLWPMGQSLTNVISTIGTETPLTMRWQTWSAYQQISTTQNIPNWCHANLMPWREKKPLNGIKAKRGVYGTGVMQNEQRAGRSGSGSSGIALNVMQSFKRWLEKAQWRKNTVQPPAKWLRIANVKHLDETSDVWCLTVPDSAEFSLANGAVVHNCSHPSDAFRMVAVSWSEVADKPPAPEAKPLIVGPENTVTLNDMWAVHDRTPSKRARI